MSYAQYFAEVEAVCQVLEEWVAEQDDPDSEVVTATWQAVELLSRAYTVLTPLVTYQLSMQNLQLPDVSTDG